MRRSTRIVILLVALLLLAACQPGGEGAGEASPSAEATAVIVEAAETDAGTSLVGPNGGTLYIFTQDSKGTSTCTDECATLWPPFEVEAGAQLNAGEGVTGELGTIERDDGTTQVTYEGLPLYFYAEDAEPGDAAGEGVGGVWFIASPEGAPASPTDGASPTEDDGGGGGGGEDDASPTEDPYDYGS